jgi:hypothetical protein
LGAGGRRFESCHLDTRELIEPPLQKGVFYYPFIIHHLPK